MYTIESANVRRGGTVGSDQNSSSMLSVKSGDVEIRENFNSGGEVGWKREATAARRCSVGR